MHDHVNLEKNLRSSALVADGFMGCDRRTHQQIIQADAVRLRELRLTTGQIADMLDALTQAARRGLGAPALVTPELSVCISDTRGLQSCPWEHPGAYAKTVTQTVFKDGRPALQWSELSVHMLRAHGFLQGQGSPFRLDPAHLADLYRITRACMPDPPTLPAPARRRRTIP